MFYIKLSFIPLMFLKVELDVYLKINTVIEIYFIQGIFKEGKYFDISAEYAKRSPDEVLGVITVTNFGSEEATIQVLPTVWYRNTWIWGCRHEGCTMKPSIKKVQDGVVHCKHDTLPKSRFYWGKDQDGKTPKLLFTENETNSKV